ncbi:MAG: endo-1,4-beta-xylanase, partial [Prevotellaceae bacterium]|nr:endo-1,4-beta-xylanase [Prevotellaceae bacterium]
MNYFGRKAGRGDCSPNMNKIAGFAATVLLTAFVACSPLRRNAPDESLASLAEQFQSPPMRYRPHVWWHWMGSNFSKEGIAKDLEAMKEAGIGGATVFNITSSVQHTQAPMENNPWPERTFRGEAYWDALRGAMAEARRLGLTMGLHGTPGYATTGGPWIAEERCMKTLVMSVARISGGREVEMMLERPALPQYIYRYVAEGVPGEEPGGQASYYRDVAVMAVPDGDCPVPDEVLDISLHLDSTGRLKWQAPAGAWLVCRAGYAPTMANPHPLPDDIIGKALEVDKMSREDNVYHWRQVLDPLKEHIGEYFGTTFTYIWVDSYESGDQDWTPAFRDEFRRMKGYDPLPAMVLQRLSDSGTTNPNARSGESLKLFMEDFKAVRSRLYIDNGWKVARDMLHEYGLKQYWEPYWGPFDRRESAAVPDVPVTEFWTGSTAINSGLVVPEAVKAGKRIIGAEAFTGRPRNSRYTEDPAFMKRSGDIGFASGANLYFLHHWVHQPFDDRYQPGMGMGWWGSHFGRHQTWFKPGKAFFVYLARCQMLLQQGEHVLDGVKNIAHRTVRDAEIFFVVNPSDAPVAKTYAFPVSNRAPELWDAYSGTIRQTNRWRADGDSIRLDLKLEPDESVFVVFPKDAKCAYEKLRLPAMEIREEKVLAEISGAWKVRFQPKLDTEFSREFPALVDFSKHADTLIKYFAGTASYEKNIRVDADALGKNKRILLDLGEMHDIAELEVNGKSAGTLWCPPYKTDITPYLKKGENRITVHVTVNWANRLIGDEQHPADFEWGRDRGEEGRAMKAFPEWFVRNEPRPSQGRKAFTIWYYFRRDSPLYPAGLIGPAKLLSQTIADEALANVPEWKRKADTRIEQHRKSDVNVRVTLNGKPVSGASVEVEMLENEFLFGCYADSWGVAAAQPDNETCKRLFAELFNYATLPFYWDYCEPEKDKPLYARSEEVAAWCAERNIRAKGHPLIWNKEPAWTKSFTDKELYQRLVNRATECTEHFRGKIDCWDVINEIVTWKNKKETAPRVSS